MVTVVTLSGVAFIGYDTYKSLNNKQQPVSKPQYSSVKGASINLFKTKYFQFQANDKWKEVTTETKEGHYVYRGFNGALVERDLVIDINKTTEEVAPLVRTTRVMPIEVIDDGHIRVVEGAGEHCSAALPKNAPLNPTKITSKNVSFICTPDAVVYQVSIGLVKGTTTFPLLRPGGVKATYTITYRDLTVAPNDTQLRDIVSTFQTR